MKKKIVILGSTGSIGQHTLEVIEKFPEDFEIVGITGNRNYKLLTEQIKKFKPKYVVIGDENLEQNLKKELGRTKIELMTGLKGLVNLCSLSGVDMVVVALVGAIGLKPALTAIERGKDLALANKEVMVMAGELITSKAKKHGIKILPIDSEHSAIFQSMDKNNLHAIRRLILTASGGPFLNFPIDKMHKITVREALCHPKWKMGQKVTIDSSTLMNKALEVIEARWLFDIDFDRIEVLIHPESIIHSMVEYIDGAIIAQLGRTDMRIPIQYALTYPERKKTHISDLDWKETSNLTFLLPDIKKFPCLGYGYKAGKIGGTMPAVLNASNEIAVNYFIAGKIKYTDIPKVVKHCIDKHKLEKSTNLDIIIKADTWAREFADEYINLYMKGK
ncbi:MAG: 1-deoxy-D-xylulose-5-phosphate reductoisomerase [Candidatus Firestonebacteria bacterium]|nr:1-deoxy-D-xylulose-5-phosphate reductoisomerase [Candidatus Firestonebacteria bacterium]